jgi:hypothetical protein
MPATSTDTDTGSAKRKPLGAVYDFIKELRRGDPEADTAEICRRYVAWSRDHVDPDALCQDRIVDLVAAWLNDNIRDKRVRATPLPEREAEKAAYVQRIAAGHKELVVTEARTMFLEMVMPWNGRRLADCTGAMCKRGGGFFAEIGKRLNPRDKVGNHLTETEIAAIAHTYRIEDGER